MPAHIIKFIPRQQQLQLRGSRNYTRWMRTVKGLVAEDGPERAQWKDEQFAELKADRDWSQRHGPLQGAVSVLRFSERKLSVRPDTSKRPRRRSSQK